MKINFERAEGTKVRLLPVLSGQPCEYMLPAGKQAEGAVTWYYRRKADEQDALVIGMGEFAALKLESVRRAGGRAARALLAEAQPLGELSAEAALAATGGKPEEAQGWVQAWIEGWLLGLYQYDKYRGKSRSGRTVALSILPDKGGVLGLVQLEAAEAEARLRAEAAMLTRDLVNDTPDGLHPASFVIGVERHFAGLPVKLRVFQGEELVKRQMNGLLAVGAGSSHSPALIEIAYEGAPGEPLLALVGKGVTFDMGGMNVKTGRDISDARMDMGGAAAVAGAMDILARTQAKVNVTALLAVVDNLPGPGAMLPSSVVQYPNGLTVQVANTDGEGRLIIADALLHAAALGASKVIDIATLTGNVGAALGLGIAGIWGDEAMTRELVAIGERNGERLWPMPLMDEYELSCGATTPICAISGPAIWPGRLRPHCSSGDSWTRQWIGFTLIWQGQCSINPTQATRKRERPVMVRGCWLTMQ